MVVCIDCLRAILLTSGAMFQSKALQDSTLRKELLSGTHQKQKLAARFGRNTKQQGSTEEVA